MRRVRELLLTLGAVLGALCLVLGIVAVTVGVHLLVFRSGSMSPTIDTGDLALTRTVDATELRVDDVVSVIDSSGNRVTHRVVNLAEQGSERQLTMRGDANQQPDAEVYTVREAQRVVFVVPKAGYVVDWSTGPVGLVLLGGYGAFLLSVLLRRKDRGRRPASTVAATSASAGLPGAGAGVARCRARRSDGGAADPCLGCLD